MRTHFLITLATFMAVSFSAVATTSTPEQDIAREVNQSVAALEALEDGQKGYVAVLQEEAPLTSPLKAYVRLLLAGKEGAELSSALERLEKETPEIHAWAVIHSVSSCKPACSLDAALATLLDRYPNNAYLHLLNASSANGTYTFEDGKAIIHYENSLSAGELATLKAHIPGLVEYYSAGGLKPERIQGFLAIAETLYPYPEKCVTRIDGKKVARSECASAAQAIISASQSREPVMYAIDLQRNLCLQNACSDAINNLVSKRMDQVREHYQINMSSIMDRAKQELNDIDKDNLQIDLL